MTTQDQTYHFDLTGFLNRLKQEGFFIGVDTHLSVQKIMAVLPADSGKAEVSALLMPLLCKSPKQQVTFKVVFQQFWRENLTLKKHDEKPPTDSPTAPQPNTPKSKNPLNQWLQNLQIWLKKYTEQFTNWLNKNREQKAVAKAEHGIPPDKYRDLFAEAPPVTMPEVLTKAVARLRTREPLGIRKLDIEKTIEKSIKNIGTFTPVYTNYTRYTEYLILIQADNPDDHKARLYNSFFEEMQYRNIPVVRYYFRSNPLICYDEHHSEGIELTDLLRQQSNAVLIVFAQLHTFLSPRNDEPFKWVHELARLPFRCLFLPFNSELEAHLSRRLDEIFDCVLPATDIGVEQLETYLQNPDKSISLHQFSTTQNTFPIQIDSEEDIRQLPTLLPPQLLKWIAACAIYPDFSWKMTLFLGEALSTDTQVYNTWENIRQLARVSCFKEAYMPQYVRRYILEKTDWLLQDDIQLIKQSIHPLIHQNQAANFKGIPTDFLSRIYLEPENEQEKEQLEAHLEEEVDYTTATLINSDRFKDVLLFVLESFDRLVPPPHPALELVQNPINKVELENDALILDAIPQKKEIYEERPINIFIAYSRKDIKYLKHIKTHLSPLKRKYENLNIWHDGEIVPGEIWSEEIKKHIHNDEIILLLISADSLASQYFYEEEVKYALERHQKGETMVIPIIVKACLWQETSFAELQVLPKDGKPISQWDNESAAYSSILEGIYDTIKLVLERKVLEKKKSDRVKLNELLTLIDTDIDDALDVLDNIFGNSNGIYNDLNGEFVARTANFNMGVYRSKLKRFVRRNEDYIRASLIDNYAEYEKSVAIINEINAIKDDIAEGKTKTAIKSLLYFVRNAYKKEYENNIINIRSKYNTVKEERKANKILFQEYRVELTNINVALLDIINLIEEDIQTSIKDKPTPSPPQTEPLPQEEPTVIIKTIDEIKDTIANNQIKTAIKSILHLSRNEHGKIYDNEIIILSNRYYNLREQQLRGATISHEQTSRDLNEIRKNLLEILNKIENNTNDPESLSFLLKKRIEQIDADIENEENKTSSINLNLQKKIYISYAHAGMGKQVTEFLDKSFQDSKVLLKRDEREVGYRESFKEYMAQLGADDYVIVVIDKPYLESYNCMYELIELYKNEQFRERTFPIVLPDAQIYDAIQRLSYIKYWEDKITKLNEVLRIEDSLVNPKSVQKELDVYIEIRGTFDNITDILADMRAFELGSYQKEGLQTVFETIHNEISKDNYTNQSLLEDARKLIIQGEVRKAITVLQQSAKFNNLSIESNNQLNNQLRVILTRYSQLEHQKRQLTISESKSQTVLAKINEALLGIISNFEQ